MQAAELAELSEESLDEHVSWIDWRSEEEEVVEAVQNQTGEPLEVVWSEGDYQGDFMVKWGDSIYKIPLTFSPVDRYVAICSLAEIMKNNYTFFLRDGFDGSDTHGLLVVSNECAKELKENFSDWLNENFHPLEMGIDQFSGLKIPYYGNESNNPKMNSDINEMRNAQNEFQQALDSQLNTDKIGRELRINIGTATLKDKLFFYSRRYWWILLVIGWVIWRNNG